MIRTISLSIGHGLLSVIRVLGGSALLMKSSLQEFFTKPFYGYLVAEQVYLTGIKSLPLVCITAISVGMVMALQFGLGLEKFGGKLYVPRIVSVSFIRELGPAFTALMLASRVASGIASEIGSMKVSQQIDAIAALGTSPIKRIVIPRILGVVIALPILAAIANVIGIVGGLIVGATELGLDPEFYYKKLVTTLEISDFISGLAKTPFFGLFIAGAGCYYGLNSGKGTKGVGIATTQAVVSASILIFVSDFFLTKLFWYFEQWLS